MPFSTEGIETAVAEARAKGMEKGVKFEQSFDIAVNFRRKEMDTSKPENRLNQEVTIAYALYPPAKVCAFGEGEFAEKASAAGAERVVSKDEIPKIGEAKATKRSLAKTYDFFIASTDTMPLVGRYLGQALGTRGKMPKPYPPQADLKAVVGQYRRTVRVRMKNTPTFHVKVGHIKMSDKEIAENIAAVLRFVESKGHAGKVSSVLVKTTMGPPVQISV